MDNLLRPIEMVLHNLKRARLIIKSIQVFNRSMGHDALLACRIFQNREHQNNHVGLVLSSRKSD